MPWKIKSFKSENKDFQARKSEVFTKKKIFSFQKLPFFNLVAISGFFNKT